MKSDKNHYVRLPDDSEDLRSNPARKLRILLVTSAFLNIVFAYMSLMPSRERAHSNGPHIYSPAQHVVTQKLVKFTRGVEDDIPIYERPPAPDVDEAWRELYSGKAQTKVPRSEAVKFPNKTWPLLGEQDSYMFSLDIFHELHCLDVLRQQLHPGNNYRHVPQTHIRHCIGTIRQALMCAVDITPVVWQWSEKHKMAEQRDDIVHVCRDYDRIREWAGERTFEYSDISLLSIYIEDDLTVTAF
ncbi:hypothetical protein C8J57DRAFT_1528018 [Mycena rebaudengoi]|nr:hypothetical protein C8J57DRAFT_1528018 [Mycena rebaudengoi]